AFNDPENRTIIIGETLKIHNGNNNDPKKTSGTVVSFTDNGFIVEIPSTTYDIEDEVNLYRTDETDYIQKNQVGKGIVSRVPYIPLVGEGRIATILVSDEQVVKKGDVLFCFDTGTSIHDSNADGKVLASHNGYLSKINVVPGQQVIQNQLLFSISNTSNFEGVIKVDEMDIHDLSVNSVVEVVFDAFPEEKYSCIVNEISSFGIQELDTTKYDVTLTFPQSFLEKAKIGMHFTAYWTNGN
ncbi:MAG: HlyD family efflux transporter periplasmic adaptor subunit, partial [Clostridiales bacterium]|nr:HlyD family efflux transporter periplasmic adaptor subunit [Clostridiales bacterium]